LRPDDPAAISDRAGRVPVLTVAASGLAEARRTAQIGAEDLVQLGINTYRVTQAVPQLLIVLGFGRKPITNLSYTILATCIGEEA
jgi:hypothetical protein